VKQIVTLPALTLEQVQWLHDAIVMCLINVAPYEPLYERWEELHDEVLEPIVVASGLPATVKPSDDADFRADRGMPPSLQSILDSFDPFGSDESDEDILDRRLRELDN
jgi:hypothetical protein